jgi:serine/threonine protein kinase
MIAQGTLIANRYRVKSMLGGGAMKQVYLAEDLHVGGRYCALAEMTDSFSDSAERDRAIKAFSREAELLAELRNERIPRFYDTFTDGNRHYLAMEYVPGKTLEQILAENGGKLGEKRAVGIALQIADTLQYLHGLNPPIIYRDLKPSNVIVGPYDKIKLIDFGIARYFAPLGPMTMIGTPGYAAPEQYEGKAGPMSDVFGLGALIHHMLSGRDPANHPPFSFPPLDQICRCDPQLAFLVSHALAYDAAKRGPSAAEFDQSLKSIEQGAGFQPNAPTAKLSGTPRTNGPSGSGLAAFLLVVLLIGVFYNFLSSSPSVPDNRSDPDRTPQELDTPTATPSMEVIDMGRSIRVDDLRYHVEDVEIRNWVGTTREFLAAPPGARFIVITYVLTNEGKESQSEPYENMEIEDAGGRRFKSDSVATRDYVWAHPSATEYSELHPEVPSELTQVFILPNDALATRLTLVLLSKDDNGASGGIVLKMPKEES